MPRYKVLQNYESATARISEGDEVEMTTDVAEFVNRDSPGTVEEIGTTEVEENAVASEDAGELLAELRHQQPTIDIDVEDKMKEIPGEGNKRTPASGFIPAEEGVRTVKSANRSGAKDRMQRGSGNADPANLVDTSANARVTSETPASVEATDRQLAGAAKDRAAADAELAASLADDDSDDASKDSKSGTESSKDKPKNK